MEPQAIDDSKYQQQSETCKLMVCRYDADQPLLSRETRAQIVHLAQGRLEVVFAGAEHMRSIRQGDDGRVAEGEPEKIAITRLTEEASKCQILIIVARGRPQKIPWFPFLAGVATTLPGDAPQIVCLHPQRLLKERIHWVVREVPNRFIPAEHQEVRRFLQQLYNDVTLTRTKEPLFKDFPKKKEEEDQLNSLVTQVCDAVNGGESKDEYLNPYLVFTFPPSCSELGPKVSVKSTPHVASKLFGSKPPEEFDWTLVDKALTKLEERKHVAGSRLFHQWADQLEAVVASIRNEDKLEQITGRLIAADDHVYRPEIELYRSDGRDGEVVVTVTFSPQIQDDWLAEASQQAAVGYNLTLAARIRHDLVEKALEDIKALGRPEHWSDLRQSVEGVLSDGAFFMTLAGRNLNLALGRSELEVIQKDFEHNVYPDLTEGLAKEDASQLAAALESWDKNNRDFFKLALGWYAEALGEGLARGSD